MTVHDLSHVNASLNALAAVLLLTGFSFIRARRVTAHKTCMISATFVSFVFLICYLVYHYNVGSVKFTGQGTIRTVYFAILISHTALAAAVPVLVIITLYRALTNQFEKHRRIARWTFPIWLYVSITGVVVYLMLYQFGGSGGPS